MRWSLYRRRYELFAAQVAATGMWGGCDPWQVQFGVVDAPPLSIDFDIKDSAGATVAAVAKDFTTVVGEVPGMHCYEQDL